MELWELFRGDAHTKGLKDHALNETNRVSSHVYSWTPVPLSLDDILRRGFPPPPPPPPPSLFLSFLSNTVSSRHLSCERERERERDTFHESRWSLMIFANFLWANILWKKICFDFHGYFWWKFYIYTVFTSCIIIIVIFEIISYLYLKCKKKVWITF